MTHDHSTITFDGFAGVTIEDCPGGCGKKRWLGTLADGCRECQGCFHKENGLAPLPSDSMP